LDRGIFAVYSGKLISNPKEMEGRIFFESVNEVVQSMKNQPDRYPIWFRGAVDILIKSEEVKRFL